MKHSLFFCLLNPFVLSSSKHKTGLPFDPSFALRATEDTASQSPTKPWRSRIRANGPHTKFLVAALCYIALSSTHNLHGLVIIRSDEAFPYGFITPGISAAMLQKSTGTFFISLEPAAAAISTELAIAKALRPNFLSAPKFIGIATDPAVEGKGIEFLTVSDQPNGKTVLPFVMTQTEPFSTARVSAILDNGNNFSQSTEFLHDANNTLTAGIVQLATNPEYIFAAVRPSGAGPNNNFGNNFSGIALMSLATTTTAINIFPLDAATGDAGNLAYPLDAQSLVLTGTTTAGHAVVFSTADDDVNQVAFYYDDPFERLYIGLRIATGPLADDIAKAVTVGRIDKTDDSLVLEPIVTNSAIDTVNDQIIVAKNSINTDGPSLRANYLSVMHTSAGPSYLIVQGGNGTTDETGNLIFALPLVDKPSDPAIHGTLANKNVVTNFKFTTPATTTDELVTDAEPAAQVGSGQLPLLPTDQITDMVVVGDAVFISIGIEASEDNDTGILYSQALFSADGAIINWTPWTKRASPMDLFPQIETPVIGSGVQFFDIDATTGNVYVVTPDNGTDQTLVGITAWTDFISTDTTSLINKLNDALQYGSYSVLDLPQSVRGFTSGTAGFSHLSRYALFGGVNKVAFARISQAYDSLSLETPQEVITDFTNPENFLVTTLPPMSGCVQVLEYSRRTAAEGATNYFFAGTENGLFVFADAQGNGFNVDNLATLNEPPFTTGQWQKIDAIKGSVIDIKSSGLALYILTFETTPQMPLKNTLYRICFDDTLQEMFHPFMNICPIAQTQTDPVFGTTQLFTGMQIIATGTPDDVDEAANKEQLILATNQGLYKSNANQTGPNNRGIADAEDQIGAHWELVPTTTNTMYTGISGIETPIRHTTWPINVQNVCDSFDASSVEQLSGNGVDDAISDTGVVGFAPIFFNADEESPAFQALEPITYFFSDGGRRFFIVNPTGASSTRTQLSVIPFDTEIWNLKKPQTLNYPTFKGIQRFFWVQPIGMSGIVLAGTNRGVIGLA